MESSIYNNCSELVMLLIGTYKQQVNKNISWVIYNDSKQKIHYNGMVVITTNKIDISCILM